MDIKKLMTRTFLVGPALAAILGMGILIGCSSDNGAGEGRESGGGEEVSEQVRGEGSGGEHGGAGEGAEGSDVEGTAGEGSGSEGGEGSGGAGSGGSEEACGANLAPDETFDMVRSGARLIMNYDAASNSFKGTVENTTNNVLTNVWIEVHLSNGTELGPTTPVDLAPGQVMTVTLDSTQASLTGWIGHAEAGSGGGESSGGGEGAGEHGGSGGVGTEGAGEGSGGESGSEAGGESGGTGAEAGEAAMSSPVIPLVQTWDGNLGGLAVSARYDVATQSVQATVQNTLSQLLCYVQAEPHLKSGMTTVGELGPDVARTSEPGPAGGLQRVGLQ